MEGIVNEKILDDIPVQTFEKPIEEAKEMGAMMLFGEKYGDVVRVVQAGDFSLEFCGGTHLRAHVAGGPVQDRLRRQQPGRVSAALKP